MSLHTVSLRYFTTLVGATFVLNWFWEMLQMPAYVEMAGRSWSETAWRCTQATFGDVAITMIAYGIGALAAGQLAWGRGRSWNVYGTGAVLGALFATSIEHIALAHGRWTYNENMPIVPFLAVGLWPLLQLTLLVPLSLAAARWATSAKKTKSP